MPEVTRTDDRTTDLKSEHTESGIDSPAGSECKDLVQGDASRRGLEQNNRSSVWVRSDEGHLEEYQEYMLRGKRISR